jgi:hypothetical protein
MPLPEYRVERFHIDLPDGSTDLFRVICPRCSRSFWVEPGPWRLIVPVMGRSEDPPAWPVGRTCPYAVCGKVSAIPEDLQVRQGQQALATGDKPRRVVRRKKSRTR